MTNDKIAEIRARHERDKRYGDGLCPGAHADRATLLAEIERLRAFNINAARETLEAVGKAADDAREEMRAEVERLREVIRTIRARCVELDDSDAVSEALDISSAALGEP